MRITNPVPLVRSFSSYQAEHASEEQEILAALDFPPFKQWHGIDEGYRSVILGEAGAGKTFEMWTRARHMEDQGHAAFLIRIEDINEDFEQAFEVGCGESFEDWLGSQREAWFYLDSIDEARLSNPRDFEKAIKRFSTRIKDAQTRAHICISSRPYAWRTESDRNLIERSLPFRKRQREQKGETSESQGQSTGPESALEVYQLRPLEEDQVRQFAVHRLTPEVDRLIDELKRLNLLELAGRPFDLEGILVKWTSDRELGGQRELLRHNIEAKLKEIDSHRDARRPLSLEKSREGARLLAAAVTLTGEPGIRVPDNSHERAGIDARMVLADWNSYDIETLLQKGIFDGVIYGGVRIRHRKERELLAAEWFLELLQKGGSRHAIESLIFRDQYGHQIITPRLRPILPWLLLDDENIRTRALAIDPEIALEGGDPAQLPPRERKKILVDIVKQIVFEEEKSAVHYNHAIALIAKPDLTEETLTLIERYADHDAAIFFLGRLVWQGKMADCVPRLSDIASDPARGIYARIAATRAILTCGTQRRRRALWDSFLMAEAELPRELFAQLVQNAHADASSVALLLRAIDKLVPYERFRTTGLTRALHGFIDRMPDPIVAAGNSQPLAQLVGGLRTILDRPPFVERRHCRVSKDFSWLLGPATHAVERLISARSEAAMQDHALTIMLKRPAARSWEVTGLDDYEHSLNELVPDWPELNDILFWQCINEARTRLSKDEQRLDSVLQVQWPRHYWSFGIGTLSRVLDWVKERELEDDRLVALSLAFRIYADEGRRADILTDLQRAVVGDGALEARLDQLLNPVDPIVSEEQLKRREENLEIKRRREQEDRDRESKRTDWIAFLKANPDRVRNPPGMEPGGFSNDQCWLYREVEGAGQRSSRNEGASWKALIEEFGNDVAHAYRDAAISHWRHYKPGLRSERPGVQSEGSSGSVISYSLLFAMAGLEIEAQEVKEFPGHLSESEVRHALRYITLELNGFPSWLEAMYRTFPQAVIEAIETELFWELENTQPGQQLHYILDDLIYSPWLHAAIAVPLLEWMRAHDVPNCEAQDGSLSILRGSNVNPRELAMVAQSKIAAGQPDEHLPSWYALWVDSDPDTGIPAIANWLECLGSSEASSHAAQLFISILMGTTGGRSSGPYIESFRTAEHLKALYVLMHKHIRSEEDIDRASGRVYTPELRDNAQNARNALFRFLSEIPGKAAYVAINELVEEHPNPDSRPWMAKHALERAAQDGDLEPWTPEQVHEFGSRLILTPSTHRQLFDLTVDRLTDLKKWIEHGVDSPYVTWRRAKSESELRNLVAGWLNQNWGNNFTAAQEPELANNQRMDISLQNENVRSPVPVELKLLDKRWSGPALCERLRNQLAGDYLRHDSEGCGVMLLAWLGSTDRKKWLINGGLVGVSGLRKALKDHWDGISKDFPHVAAIKVIVIDMTLRTVRSNQ